MATISEQPKPPAAQDHPYPPPVLPYPQPYSPPFPPPPGYPPFFAYPPPPDAPHPENTQPPAPYMMAFAPSGMVYAYPPPQGAAFPPPASSVPPALAKPKRKQVKMACTNCAAACKRCDENRPCERCIKYGMSNTCVDGQRKERKKGIKRGPYKRKNKSSDNSGSYPPGQPPPPTAPPPPTGLPVPHQFPPEGFYPVYYGPPGPFMPHPPDTQQTIPDGSPAQPPPPLPHHPPHVGVNGQPAMLPPYFYAYPPFSHYPPMFPPPPGLPPPPPGTQHHPPPTGEVPQPPVSKNGEVVNGTPPVSTASTTSTSPDTLNTSDGGVAINATTNPVVGIKKRTRKTNGVNGEPKTKRTKATRSSVKQTGVVRPEEVEGVAVVGEKDTDAEGEVVDENGNGSGNESSA